jgi:flagellar motor switch protein FliM
MIPVPYDFRKPARLPPEWHKLLQGWFQTSTTLASRGWAKQFPEPVDVGAGILEDCYAQATLAELPTASIGQRIMIGQGRVPTMLVLPRTLLLNLIGIMLGDNRPQEDRELTVVEDQLADYFLDNHWLPYFRESWPGPSLPGGKQAWQLLQREAEPNYSRLFEPSDVLVNLHWKIRGPFGEGQGQWLFPRQALLQALAKEQVTADPGADEKIAAARKAQIVRALPLSIECILGTTQLRLSDLSRLQVGDVLLLDQRASDDMAALVGGRPMFRGRMGRDGSWKAFRIESFTEK